MMVDRPQAEQLAQIRPGPVRCRDGTRRPPRRFWIALLLLLGAGALLLAAPGRQLTYDAAQYADTAAHVVQGEGFVTDRVGAMEVQPTAEPSRYPPGLPALLVPAAALGDVQAGSRLLSYLYLLALVWAAWAVGGELAAWLAGFCAVLSPFLLASSQTVMADATGAMLGLTALALLTKRTRRRLILVGAATGMGLLVRMANGPLLIAAIFAVPRGQRRWVLLGAAPFVAALMSFQWYYFGSPFRSGYSAGEASWAARHLLDIDLPSDNAIQLGSPDSSLMAPIKVLPGVMYWPLAVGMWWALAPPAFGLLGVWAAWKARRGPAGLFTLMAVAGSIALFLPYYYRAARLVAPAAALLVVYACALTAGWMRSRTWALASRNPASADTVVSYPRS